jgi:drug/metabolite transporter, DME family
LYVESAGNLLQMQKKSNFSEKTSGSLLVLAGAILWGSNGTAQALGTSEAQPLVLGVLRILIGGLVLSLPIRIYSRSFPTFQPLSSILPAALSAVLYQITFFSAVKLTGVSVGTIVGIGSSPIFAGIVAWLIRGEKPGIKWYFATFAGVCGTALVALSTGLDSVILSGVFLALLSGLSYAFLAVFMKNTFQKRCDTVTATGEIFLLGGLLMLPFLFTYDLSWAKQVNGAATILYLGLVTGALAYCLFSKGLQNVTVATAGTLTLGEPLTAGILGVLILGEQLTLPGWSGICLLLVGLIILTMPTRKRTLQ